MTVKRYVQGQVIRISLQVKVSTVLTDPTAVAAKVTKPDGTTTLSGAATHDGTGLFHYDFTADQAGTYWYRFEGTGAAAGAGEKELWVEPTRIAA